MRYLYHLIRSIFLWILLVAVTIFFGSLVMPFAIFRASKLAHGIARVWGRSIGFLSGIRIFIQNREKLFRDGPVIYVSNHQSMFDIPVLYSALDTQFRWMAKASLFKIPLVGWGMAGAGYIPVERDNRKKAMESLFTAAERIHSGASVVIFPEGTRSEDPDKGMLPFKKGGFVLAKKANVTIQPVTIWGANHIMPAKQKGVWVQRVYSGAVQVEIHDPIPASDYADLSADQLGDKVRVVLEKPMAEMMKKLKEGKL